MGFHYYKIFCKPAVNEHLKVVVEPNKEYDKFSVAEKEREKLGHLKKGTTGRFAKMIFFFLRTNNTKISHVKDTGEIVRVTGK